MGRYRGYRHRYHSYSYSKYIQLTSYFGDAVIEIRHAFLHLPEDAADELLEDYAAIHGHSAAKYAKATLPNWRSGKTQMSGQTMERLIELVPPYLTADQRFELLLGVVRKHQRRGITHNVFVNRKDPAEGLRQIDAALLSLKVNDTLAHVPEHVMSAAKWLYDDDMTTARAMLAEADRRENDSIRASAVREIGLLRRAIGSGQVRTANYAVVMPAGRLQVRVDTKSMCFVATACFGEMGWQTIALRRWRDERLLRHAAGRAFVNWYYRHGPELASLVAVHPLLRSVARRIVSCVARFVHAESTSIPTCNHRTR